MIFMSKMLIYEIINLKERDSDLHSNPLFGNI